MRNKGAYDTLKPMDISRWQHELREVIRAPGELLEKVGLQAEKLALSTPVSDSFPLKAPLSYLKRIRAGVADDPLLRQILPLAEEDRDVAGYRTDPLDEITHTTTPGLIRKYPGRVLLITTSVCAIHCRYCFRRHYPYNENSPSRENWTAALDTIRNDSSIYEVILSGGDPLSLSDEKLDTLIQQLETIPHVRWLRIHTRIPVVLPSRMTDKLLQTITRSRFKLTMVIHANHPHEIENEVIETLQRLHQSGMQLLNQSVLLKGVNDQAPVLAELSHRLYTNHVLPYYLHMLDPVAGAAHFEVAEDQARDIHKQLQATLPGYLVPKLVRELPGESSKTLLG